MLQSHLFEFSFYDNLYVSVLLHANVTIHLFELSLYDNLYVFFVAPQKCYTPFVLVVFV